MEGQWVGNDDYLLATINPSPGNMMLSRGHPEGINPQYTARDELEERSGHSDIFSL